MTTREEYAEAAEWHTKGAAACARVGATETEKHALLAARVLRQLAEGAVLCSVVRHTVHDGMNVYRPIEMEEKKPESLSDRLRSHQG
jgi:hypothetical protein